MHGADEQLEREQDFKQLSKKGCFEQLEMLWDGGQRFDLAKSFELAVTDFRTIRRNAGHMQILKFCIDRGLDPLTRVDWMRQPLICTASMYGNHEIVSYIVEKCGQPEAPMVRASLGDVAFFLRDSAQPAEELRELRDENGFNLLHYAVASGLGRVNSEFRSKQEETCRFLIESGVKTDLAVNNNIEITPALLCTWFCGNSNIMQMLLDADEIEISSLHQAVEFAFEPHQRSGKPFEDVANVILENGFDINSIRPDQNRTLLHGSSNRGAIAAVAWLLANGANPNLVDESGRTSLHVAAIRNTHDRVVRKLIECGAKIDTCDANGKTALELAKENNRQNVSTFLGSIENDQGESAKPIAKLIGAIKDADLSTVTEILHAHPNLANTPIESLTKNRSQTLLHLAMPGDGRQDSVAHVGIVKLLIECGAVVDALGEGPNLGTCTPLTIAGWGGHVRLIEPLIKNGANVDGHPDSEQSPLQAAARHGHSEAVEALVVAGARYELAELVMAGLENRVKELLHANPELVNEPTESGATLLHAALESNRGSSLVPMLLELGADKARRDATGRTPLQMAIEQQIWWDFSKYVSALKDEASTENIFVAAGLGEVEKVRG